MRLESMKPALALLLVGIGLAACDRKTEPAPVAQSSQTAAGARKAIAAGWTVTEGIKTPESVVYDEASGFVFTSQINGAPDGRDGNGTIAKLNGDGTVVKADFVTGLNAPKGLRVCDGTLWTADINEVIGIDAASGAVKSRVAIPASMFLNDVACTGATVYVTDMMANKIYRVANGAATVVAEGDLE